MVARGLLGFFSVVDNRWLIGGCNVLSWCLLGFFWWLLVGCWVVARWLLGFFLVIPSFPIGGA